MNFFGRRGIHQEEASSSSYHKMSNNNNNNNNTELMLMDSSPPDIVIEKEHMFDKVVTPSDVGKLNRLVIPKQHAEKYFPLDSSSNDKGGLLLNFEDSYGKPWRFRYSYWNSSQSYVMTKGWSRFVKEKKLDAGDIVSFHRGAGELFKHRLFIDWRRRPSDVMSNHFMVPHHFSDARIFSLVQPNYPTTYSLNSNLALNYCNPHSSYMYGIGGNTPYYMMGTSNFNSNSTTAAAATVGLNANPFNNLMMRSVAPQGVVERPRVFDSVPVVQGKVAAKRFRLFGVNMDCPMDHPDISTISTTTTTYPHFNNSNPTPSEESSEKGKSFNLDF